MPHLWEVQDCQAAGLPLLHIGNIAMKALGIFILIMAAVVVLGGFGWAAFNGFPGMTVITPSPLVTVPASPSPSATTILASPRPTASMATTGQVVVLAQSLNLRAGPGLEYLIKGWLMAGDQVEVKDCQDGWAWLPAFDGWAHGSWLDPDPCQEGGE